MAIPKVSVASRQNTAPEQISFFVDESAIVNGSNAGILEGENHGIITKNGTGDYTITLRNASRRTISVVGYGPAVANLQAQVIVTTTTVQIVFTNNSGAATNTDFHLTVQRYDSAIAR